MKKVLIVLLSLVLSMPLPLVHAKSNSGKISPYVDDGSGASGYPATVINSVTMYAQSNSDYCGPYSVSNGCYYTLTYTELYQSIGKKYYHVIG